MTDLPRPAAARLAGRAGAAVRKWPISVRMMAALAAVLFPLGVMTVVAARKAYSSVTPDMPMSTAQVLTVALPVLMWLAALLTAWWLAHALVVNPVVSMQRTMRRYSAGDTDVRLGGSDFVSREMSELAEAFDAMADQIGRNEREIRAVLAEQKRLTREVHHRVKNNLQIVSSLLSIQSRDAPTPEVADAYAAVQARVGALALVHRWMYGDEASPGVDLRSLVTDLCASLEQSLAAIHRHPVHLSCDIARVAVGEDTAVPIAFLITELLSAAARLNGPGPLEGRVTATAGDGRVTVSVCASPFGHTDVLADRVDPAARIITGMARQLRTPIHHDSNHTCYTIDIALPARVSPETEKK